MPLLDEFVDGVQLVVCDSAKELLEVVQRLHILEESDNPLDVLESVLAVGV